MKQESEFILSIAKDTGSSLAPDSKVLDFGCGAGELVQCFLDQGLDAYGADIEPYWITGTERTKNPRWQGDDLQRFQKIEWTPYRLPFEDNTFDFCCSTVVFEHVQNYRESFAEIQRVLKPGGSTLHIFPSRWHILESHVFVPLASVFQSLPYLSMWAILGIRNQYQKGKTWREIAQLNADFLQTQTTYLSAQAIREHAMATFGNIQFPHQNYVRHHYGKIGQIGRLFPIPGYSALATTFGHRAIYMRKEQSL
jgi:SAM-dependent methyltransferase